MEDKYNLKRFIEAQESDYEIALLEIKSGKKRSHWMWYIFPQLSELGYSSTAKYYGISNIEVVTGLPIDKIKEYFQE